MAFSVTLPSVALLHIYRCVCVFLPSHLHSTHFSPLPLFAGQPGSVDPGQPLVNTIRSDSALIGGNAILLSRNKNKSKDYKSWIKTFGKMQFCRTEHFFFWLFISFSCDCVYASFLLHVWLTAVSSCVCVLEGSQKLCELPGLSLCPAPCL